MNLSFYEPFFITIVLFLGLVALITWFGSRKAGKIPPVEAIRSDTPTGTYSKRPSIRILTHAKAPIPVFLGMRILFANKRRAAYTAFSMLFVIFILTFSINVSNCE